MRAISAILTNTATEIMRDKILYGLFIFAAALVLLSLLLGGLSFAEQARIITNLGLVAGQLGCSLIAIFIGGSLVWKEIEKQTVLVLLSKPVTRTEFLLGKFLGLALVIFVVNFLIAGMVAVVCAIFSKVTWQPFLMAQVGILLESWILLGLGIFFGTFSRPIITTFATFSLWVIGHFLENLAYFSERSTSLFGQKIGIFLSKALPDLEVFNFKAAAVYGDPLMVHEISKPFVVFALWTALLLISSSWIFSKRDFT